LLSNQIILLPSLAKIVFAGNSLLFRFAPVIVERQRGAA
jgi:hypothetical protein